MRMRAMFNSDELSIRMRHMLVGLGLRAFAGLIAAFGLLMLELSAYFALVQIWSTISAAAVLSVVNFVIAAVLFVVGGRPPAGRELELATEIHGSAVEALQTEARALQSQFTGMVHHPLNSVLPLVPLITIIVKSLKTSCQQTKEHCRYVQDPAKADFEFIPAGTVSAIPYRAGP
jgi:Putative Actinobacterial Holin-X, holin superfamily III